MRKTLIAAACGLLALTGCASNDYKLYAETQMQIARNQAQSDAMKEAARYAALAEIAKSGDSAAKVAAVMSIQLGSGSAANSAMAPVAPPKTFGDTALQWTSVLLPSLTNLYGISANRQVAITQSNNAAAVATNTNNTFATMNANGHAANVSIANSGLSTVNSVANSGITGLVTTGANGLTTATNLSNNSTSSIINLSNRIPATR